MKKFAILATLLISLSSFSAFAKTSGNYAGIDIIYSEVKLDQASTSSIGSGDQISVGVNYKYAFNFNNFFVAPGVFFDYTNIRAKASNNDEWDLDFRYGAKVDLGYDITDKFAAFVNIGLANNHYDAKYIVSGTKTSDSKIEELYGIGVKYSATDDIDVGLSYEFSNLNVKDPLNNTVKFDLEVVRLGISYNF